MVHMLSLTDNLHTILRVLYDDMMALCYPMSQVAMAIAGIGALLHIAYRVWQSMAQAEPIDLFPLMRPFAIGICILFFPTLVLGSLNGILSPLVKATHSLMVGQTLDMEQWQERRERLELESREQMPPDSYYAENEEMERELSELGVDDQTQQTLDRMNEERSSWSVKGLIFKGLAWILELLFAAASVILDVLRTFYLIVLSLLGPIAFAISVFDGFQSTLTQWLTKICLDLPVAAHLGSFLGDHRTSANPFDAPRRRPDGRRLQLVCGLVEQPEPDLHARGRVRIPLHPLDRLVGRAGERIRRLQQDRLEDDLARKRRSRMDGRQSMGRGQRRRLGGIIGR